MEASTFTKSGINILLHVIILFTFLSGFFFMYVSKIESEALKNEIGNIVQKQVSSLLEANPVLVEQLQYLQPVIGQMLKQYSQPTRYSMERNVMIKFTAIYTMLMLVAILILILLLLKYECGKTSHFPSILIHNIIIFLFIGMVEYVFFTRVASQYVPVKPSTMMTVVVDTLKQDF